MAKAKPDVVINNCHDIEGRWEMMEKEQPKMIMKRLRNGGMQIKLNSKGIGVLRELLGWICERGYPEDDNIDYESKRIIWELHHEIV